MSIKKLIKGAMAVTVLLVIAFFILNYKFYIVRSSSMESAIHVGSVTIVKPTDQFIEGDIICFNKGDSVVTHRLMSFDETGSCITKGDANDVVDPSSTPRNAVIGKVLFSVPRLGFLIVFIQEHIFLVLFVIFIVFCSRWIFSLNKEDDDYEKDNKKSGSSM